MLKIIIGKINIIKGVPPLINIRIGAKGNMLFIFFAPIGWYCVEKIITIMFIVVFIVSVSALMTYANGKPLSSALSGMWNISLSAFGSACGCPWIFLFSTNSCELIITSVV